MSQLSIENVASDLVDVGDGIRIPRGWDAVVTAGEDNARPVRLHVVYDSQLRRAVAASLRLDRAGDGDEVTTALLREIRVLEAVAQSAAQLVTVARGTDEPVWLATYLERVKSESGRSFQDTVGEAVTLYRIAATVNMAPLKFVSGQLGVSVSTATRMMARAREAGLADDLITRETYNRMRADEEQLTRPQGYTTDQSGPSIGR